MNKFLQVDAQSFLDFYDKCTPEIRESMKPLFGPQIVEYLCFKIKSYEDASKYLYGKVLDLNNLDLKSQVFTKLTTITNALNDGWDKSKSAVYYYPTFTITDGMFEFKDVKQGGYSNIHPFSNPFKFRDAALAKYAADNFLNLWRAFYV